MALKRPKDQTRVTVPGANDAVLLDQATTTSITIENLATFINAPLSARVDDLEDSANFPSIIKKTYAALAAITGASDGQRGEVTGPDEGTHTDPVVGGTVENIGIYAWDEADAGWERVQDRPNYTEEDLEAVADMSRRIIVAPIVSIDGRQVQPTELSFDLYVVRGIYCDDGTTYPETGGNNFATTEHEFPAWPGKITVFPQRFGSTEFGQSNDTNYGDDDVLTPAALYAGQVLMFNGGPLADPDSPGSTMTSTANLYESTTSPATGESPVSGFCYGFLDYAIMDGRAPSSMPQIHGHSAARSGTGIVLLRTTYYPRFTTSITQMAARATAAGKTFEIPVLPFKQGEAEQGHMDIATRRTELRAMYNQQVASVRSVCPAQAYDPIMLITQLSCWAAPTALLPDGSANTYPASVTLADVQEQGSGIFCVCPDYCLSYADDIHFDAAGKKLLGRYRARAAYRVLIKGIDWRPLQMLSSRITPDACYVKYTVPVQPLKIDQTTIGPTTQCGFKLSDSSGDLPITAISVVAGDEVKLTLGRARNGVATLRYGLDYCPVGTQTAANACGGNVRDSDVEDYKIGSTPRPLANWSLAFTSTPIIQEA